MGINVQSLKFLIAENLHREITGDVLLIGRSTVTVRRRTISAIADAYNVAPPHFKDVCSKTKHSSLLFDVDDIELFRWISPKIERIDVMDISSYEGANIIHDLNRPVPEEYNGKYDFIFDSSVLDNIFNPSCGIENIVQMLAPGGRYFGFNVASLYPGAFVGLTPEWFYAFFSINGCQDVKVYVTLQNKPGLDRFEYSTELFRYKPSFTPRSDFDHFRAASGISGVCHTVTIAEMPLSHRTQERRAKIEYPVNLQYLESSTAGNWALREEDFSRSRRNEYKLIGESVAGDETKLSLLDSDHYIPVCSDF